MSNIIHRLWVRTHLKGVGFSDNHAKLDSLYMVKDPWHMESQKEQYRFNETNRLIQEWIGHVGTALEVGCGEGHQSLFLEKCCDHLYGIDVSKKAVRRAKKRSSMKKLAVNKGVGIKLMTSWPQTFDLVTLCEVAYYAKDPELLLNDSINIGKHIFITYFEARSERLDPIVEKLPIIKSSKIAFEETSWKVFLCQGKLK